MRVRILGAGIIGLSCAAELLRRGHDVVVVDPAPGQGASYAAAGMLSPATEAWYGEPDLLDLGARSLAAWPEYAARLGVPLETRGTLLVGRDHGDLQQVERQADLLAAHGVVAEPLDREGVLSLEPLLSPRVAGGLLLSDERSVDPRDVVAALAAAVSERVTLASAATPHDPSYDVTVVATGARLPAPFAQLVRGVRGEVIRVRAAELPAYTVRGWVRGEPVYLVPRASGELVIGATSEEHDEAPVVTVGGIARLLESARELMPSLDRAVFAEAVARDRPGTADNLPLVGPTSLPGVVLAAGHFRHGVLLAPLTAGLVADHLDSGHVEPALDPRRFAA